MTTTLFHHTVGGRWEPRPLAEPGELDPVEVTRLVPCPDCWAQRPEPCTTDGPLGMHLARYRRALRRGLLPREALDAITRGLESPDDGHTMVLDDFIEKP